jgi:pyridoxal phosphate enzyme (YggS family)
MNTEMVERVAAVQAHVAQACARAGRDPESVAIVAVSKKQPPEAIAAAAAAGMTVFGESRVQEAAQKIPQCPGRLEWHFIGHLQTNKVAAAVALFSTIHSVDSWRVLEAVEQAAVAAGVRVRAMLEVNVSGERSKFGLSPEEVPGVLERGAALTRVEVVGLMTVPPFEPDPEKVRPYFAALRQGRDRWARETGLALPELSMGMTGDYGVAIEEGATCVRIGTGIFGAREATP